MILALGIYEPTHYPMSLIQAPLSRQQVKELVLALLETVSQEVPGHNFTLHVLFRSHNLITSIFYEAKDHNFIFDDGRLYYCSTEPSDMVKYIDQYSTIIIQLFFKSSVAYDQNPLCYTQCQYIRAIDIFTNTSPVLTEEFDHGTMIIKSANTTLNITPIFYNETKEIIRHGVEGLWYIRKDGQPLTYRYWLCNKVVSKVEYTHYIESAKREIRQSAVLLPELRQLISTYI